MADSAGDYFVHSLPGAPDGPLLKMHAGYGSLVPIQAEILSNMSLSTDTSRLLQNTTATSSSGISRIATSQIDRAP